MKKGIRIVSLVMLAVIIISVGSVSAVFYGQSPGTKAERIVEISDKAGQRVQGVIDWISENDTILEMIGGATLLDELEGNVTLFEEEGLAMVTDAYDALDVEDYDAAVTNATDALKVFRKVYRSIQAILYESEVKERDKFNPEALGEAIERSQERVDELQSLISSDAEIYSKMEEAEELLVEAQDLLVLGEVEEAADNLREANKLISEVCHYLKQVAKELNPHRIRGFLVKAGRYRYRFRRMLGRARNEGFEVKEFLQGFGYPTQEAFMNRIQEMIEDAKEREDFKDVLLELKEVGKTIRQMDKALRKELAHFRGHGPQGTGNGWGQEDHNGNGYGSSNHRVGQNNGKGIVEGNRGSKVDRGLGQMGNGN